MVEFITTISIKTSDIDISHSMTIRDKMTFKAAVLRNELFSIFDSIK